LNTGKDLKSVIGTAEMRILWCGSGYRRLYKIKNKKKLW